jgi:hypothetical protein
LPRTRGYGRRTVEQTRSVDIRDLRKAAYVGDASGNWLEARNKLFCEGIQPRHWNDAAITLDGQTAALSNAERKIRELRKESVYNNDPSLMMIVKDDGGQQIAS